MVIVTDTRNKSNKERIEQNQNLWARAKGIAGHCFGGLSKSDQGLPTKTLPNPKKKRKLKSGDVEKLVKTIETLEWKMSLLEEVTKTNKLNALYGCFAEYNELKTETSKSKILSDSEKLIDQNLNAQKSNETPKQYPPAISKETTQVSLDQADENEVHVVKLDGEIHKILVDPITLPYVYHVTLTEAPVITANQDAVKIEPSSAYCKLTYAKENHKIVIDYKNNLTRHGGRICLKELGKNMETVQAELVGRLACYLLGIMSSDVKINDEAIFKASN